MTERDIHGLFGFESDPMSDAVRIALASPETVLQWSKGEVKTPETVNYRTWKPEPDGLFCQRIFGPVTDYECACGKYKRVKYQGVVCDRCGVEVTLSCVRRERMGHIELAVPVAHIWFLRSVPSYLGLLADMTLRDLERVIYYESYLVLEPGTVPVQKRQLLTENEYRSLQAEFGEDAFVAKTGAEAIRDLLCDMNLSDEADQMRMQTATELAKPLEQKLSKRLRLVEGMMQHKIRPEWMILKVLPVIPPDLRPLVPLDGGRFATNDLNDLYRRVINRNNRLRSLLQLRTPDIILCNEKRMLQEAVDALFDNGCYGSRAVSGSNGRPLRSLSESLKGKQGRFRQNLLGKRVDYSGRTVIVVGPELKLYQCGLPKHMALVLFEPFIIHRLCELGFAGTVRAARKMIESKVSEVWDVLQEVVEGHPVLLNRAPTLHRLSVQAFEPVLIEGGAVRLHPLVCAAFNADFDGDQMAVHVPLSAEAVMEARLLMLSTQNLFLPASGKPIALPSQDIDLGLYVLTSDTKPKPEKSERVPIISGVAEAKRAESEGLLSSDDWVDIPNPDYGKETAFGVSSDKYIRTTVGRVIFNAIFPKAIGFVNETVGKDKLSDMINTAYRLISAEDFAILSDALKNLGFLSVTKGGLSVGMRDVVVSDEKGAVIEKSEKKIKEVESQFRRGIITNGERYNKVISIWTKATEEVAEASFEKLAQRRDNGDVNPIYMMMDSGARGNKQQVRQLCGMRGLMAKPSGEIIEQPILSSFRDGLKVLEYFTSTHGGRKGMADTALKTADAGYLTRKLCDVAMDCVAGNTGEPLDYSKGIWKQAIFDGDDEVVSLSERIIGRCACEDIVNPSCPDECIVHQGEMITEAQAKHIEAVGIDRVKILSPLTHGMKHIVPPEAYGEDMSTHTLVEEGMSVGILAAQSIGEPGTQLTLRTFHSGGVAGQALKRSEFRARNDGIVKYDGLQAVKTPEGTVTVLNGTGTVRILSEEHRELEAYRIHAGSVMAVSDGGTVEKGALLASWDATQIPILSGQSGTVRFKDILSGVTVCRVGEDSDVRMIMEHGDDLNPSVEILDERGAVSATYAIPSGARLAVAEGDSVYPGTLLAKMTRVAVKTQDIVGGLPRITELFEARCPKKTAEMARIDGVVSMAGTVRGKKRLTITNAETGMSDVHFVSPDKQIVVRDGDFVKRGQFLTDGLADPHEMLSVLGEKATQEYLLSEIQKVYRLQGVTINDKHLEVILMRMFGKIRVTDPGDTEFCLDERTDRRDFEETNRRVIEMGGKPAEGEKVLLGITKASLSADSFIAAASFQETTRILAEAAIVGKTDPMKGFKENVITGRPIPAGTGLPKYRNLSVKVLAEADAKTEGAYV